MQRRIAEFDGGLVTPPCAALLHLSPPFSVHGRFVPPLVRLMGNCHPHFGGMGKVTPPVTDISNVTPRFGLKNELSPPKSRKRPKTFCPEAHDHSVLARQKYSTSSYPAAECFSEA